MSFRALLATPSGEVESSLLLRFAEMTEWDVVSTHRSSRDVGEAVAELGDLDVALIHADLGPLPVFDLIRDLSGAHPQLAIIVVAAEVTPETYTQAMEVGARGVLAADATLEELRSRVTTAAEWSRTLRSHMEAGSGDSAVPGRHGTILTLSGGKGGVGTTTAAVHLAIHAGLTGRTVCLVDLDLQTGDLPGLLDLNHRRGLIDLVDAGEKVSGAMLAETVYVHPAGPHILLAPPEGERAEEVGERPARRVLGSLRARYDLIVVDCGSQTNDASAAAVELADLALVTLTPDLPALRGAQRLVALWERLRVRARTDVTALMVRQHRKSEIQPDLARKLLGTRMLRSVLPANFRAYEQAANTGDPSRLTDDTQRRGYGRVLAELGLAHPVSPRGATPASGALPSYAARSAPGQAGRAAYSPEAEQFITGRQRAPGDRGGTLLEFAAVTPALLLLLLLAWQVILVGLTGMYASHASAEGARQAAITPEDHELIVEEATKRIRAPWDDEEAFALQVVEQGDARYVEVSIAMPVVLPGADGPWDVTSATRILPSQGSAP